MFSLGLLVVEGHCSDEFLSLILTDCNQGRSIVKR